MSRAARAGLAASDSDVSLVHRAVRLLSAHALSHRRGGRHGLGLRNGRWHVQGVYEARRLDAVLIC